MPRERLNTGDFAVSSISGSQIGNCQPIRACDAENCQVPLCCAKVLKHPADRGRSLDSSNGRSSPSAAACGASSPNGKRYSSMNGRCDCGPCCNRRAYASQIMSGFKCRSSVSNLICAGLFTHVNQSMNCYGSVNEVWTALQLMWMTGSGNTRRWCVVLRISVN